MTLIDLSLLLEDGMPFYPGDPEPSVEQFKTVERDGHALKKMTLGTHTGTHVDAPCHFIAGGKSVSDLDPLSFSGKAYVVDVSGKTPLDELTELPPTPSAEVLLVHTGTNRNWKKGWNMSNVSRLSVSVAEEIRRRKYRVVGIDSPTVGHGDVHRLLLGNGVLIVENLSSFALSQVVGKSVLFTCIPILVKEGDGAPARAVCEYPV
ncbi:MAG: cyclase family protein [Thermoprotei archaeon]